MDVQKRLSLPCGPFLRAPHIVIESSMCHRVIWLVFVLLCSPLQEGWGQDAVTGEAVSCENGRAAAYPCRNVNLLSFLPISAIDADEPTELADIWGWTDPETGREYALVARSDGTSFVDVSDPERPVYLGNLPSHTSTRPQPPHRDIKVYRNHAYVVSEASAHGLQVFDLTRLRTVTEPPVTFEETAHYDRFGSSHNVVVNEETGYAYAVGIHGRQDVPGDYPDQGPRQCGPGLHMIDLADPADPEFAGCFTDDNQGVLAPGYTHDAQCVIYHGPDEDYRGRELCFAANEDVVSIMDVDDKSNPISIAQATYPNYGYVHQGWLSEDHRYFYLGDELDEERELVSRTRTLIWDMEDLDRPGSPRQYFAETPSIDHNLYTKDSFMMQANYTSGLRILDISSPEVPEEVGFFDTFPEHDRAVFEGAWSNYPYFESGIVIVSSIGEGLFVLEPTVAPTDPSPPPETFMLHPPAPNPVQWQATVWLDIPSEQHVTVTVYDMLGRRRLVLHEGRLAADAYPLVLSVDALASGTYVVRAVGEESMQTQMVTVVK